ncbi:MAG: hypothetical protein ACO1NZ_13620, partial [Adhaeribacter sp.]
MVQAYEGIPVELTVPLLSSLTYQWQVSSNGGSNWQDLSNGSNYANVHTRNLSINPSFSFHGYQYRCKTTTLVLTSYSDAQTLAVIPLTKILSQPQDWEALGDLWADFRVSAEAQNPTYQWQVNKGLGWEDLTDTVLYQGIDSTDLRLNTASWYMHRYQYRCLVSGDHGPTVATEPATLSIIDINLYVNQPSPGATCAGKDLVFTLTLGDAVGFDYQWQESRDGGLTWTDMTEGGSYSQTNSPEMWVTTSLDLHNFSFRCRATRGTEIFTSDEAWMGVLAWTNITAQPLSVLACPGSTTAFSLSVTGSNLAYQWQVNTGSGSWTDLVEGGGYQGTQTANLALSAVSPEMNGYQYRCKLTGDCPTELFSSTATLSVGGPGTWVGASPDWHSAGNWCGGVPTAATDITIRPDVPHMPRAAAAFCRNLTIQQGASITMTGDFTVQGIPTLMGLLAVGNDTLKLNGGPIQGNMANLQTNSGSKLVLGGSETGIFVPATISTLQTLVVSNPNGVNLTSNLSLEELVFRQGKLFLHTANLHMRQANKISGVNTSRYVVTNDDAQIGGFLTQPISSILFTVTFPVGTAASYSPAELKLQLLQSPDDFSVRVFDKVYDKGTWGTPVTSGAVNKTWLIEKADTTKSTEASVKLGWQNQSELPNFKKSAIKKGHYKNGKWEFSSGLLALVTDPLNINLNWSESGGYTNFSPFTVVDDRLTKSIANLKVFLQGPYNASTGKMNTTLRTKNLIPLTHPYAGAPWNYAGTESVTAAFFTANPEVVDWVLLEVRSTTTTKVKTVACFLKSDGSLLGIDGLGAPTIEGVPEGNYYLVVKHRNHLPIMTA